MNLSVNAISPLLLLFIIVLISVHANYHQASIVLFILFNYLLSNLFSSLSMYLDMGLR